MKRFLVWTAVASGVLACSSHYPATVAPCSPAPSAVELPQRDFVTDYAYHLEGPGKEATLRLVAEKAGERLVVVGFNEFGVKAFSLTQDGGQVHVTRNLGPLLTVSPSNVLEDLGYGGFLEGKPPGSTVVVDRRACGYRVRIERLSGRSI